ncbi:NAD(P)-dependent oxidoreductase [Bradyrhizobium sp. Arg237L]|uniref:NAD(P)-dependent oxidoreductase n=1 Tax=Bradyrhizobium sp. Arg237L TaxID=3003352 RepID=UPI00249F5C9F|nr:NAD(P)-dependent oxidoreductase [Bradyrhizobium sp. Arg237L]MDI4234204.1 NAD(P)-dependent oxidoreductase [Bradyrhizobium sp. Arg237L]
MSLDPILLIGGSGIVGRHTARYLRATAPDVPLLIGGRNLSKARKIAGEVGQAEGVMLDLTADDLSIGGQSVSAVAVLFRDEALSGFRFARKRGQPYIGISTGISEIGPEVAGFMQDPTRSAVVLGTEWLVGATSVTTLALARRFSQIDEIRSGLLLDDEDMGGPAQVSDLEGLTNVPPAALARRNGNYVWRSGEQARTRFRAFDGTRMDANTISPNDILALVAATNAPNVEINLAIGISSSRRRGESMSTEIVIELQGKDDTGRPLSTRHAVIHPQGQFPLTGLGVAMVLERCLGLDGQPPAPAGLYFPCQLLEPARYQTRLEEIGGRILALEAP